MWILIVISSTLATFDMYPGGSSRQECNRIAEKISGAEPYPAQSETQVACVRSSEAKAWLKQNYHYAPKSN